MAASAVAGGGWSPSWLELVRAPASETRHIAVVQVPDPLSMTGTPHDRRSRNTVRDNLRGDGAQIVEMHILTGEGDPERAQPRPARTGLEDKGNRARIGSLHQDRRGEGPASTGRMQDCNLPARHNRIGPCVP